MRLEFDHAALWDGNIRFGLVRISSDPGFADSYFEHAEISQFNGVSFRDRFRDVIERSLNYIEHILLPQPRFFTDPNDQIAFCHILLFEKT